MERLAKRIKVYGRVQGVGFRPSVCRLAAEYSLRGFVRNLDGIVEIAVAGAQGDLQAFLQALLALPAPAAVVRLEEEAVGLQDFEALLRQSCPGQETGFVAVSSSGQGVLGAVLPADIGVCPTCLAELEDKRNRRYHYPYISCPQCGPRYTIIRQLPYDRARTTMDEFSLCGDCSQEYHDMQQRRGHAETISCFACGPQLYGYLRDAVLRLEQGVALRAAQELLRQGKILLVKAVGGYNLVCRADSYTTVAELRRLKHRPQKPLAVMCGEIAAVEKLCVLSPNEKQLLQTAARPIVLLRPNLEGKNNLAANIAPHCAELGVFLPPMGLYKQLCELGLPLVVTSCNYSGQPIIYKDEEAREFFHKHEAISGFFAYQRKILRPADDSLARVLQAPGETAQVQLLRRTRGYLPEPLVLKKELSTMSVVAVGAQMEPSLCLATGNRLYPCQIPGDLEEDRTEALWLHSLEDWQQLLHIEPGIVVGDLHPGYTSTELGKELARRAGKRFLQVQHHHAHALAVMAEHGLEGACLAVCFDGTGYGTDATVWGGEFLLCKGTDFQRVAHVKATPMLGGDVSMKQAWKSALCYLAAASWTPPVPVKGRPWLADYGLVRAALQHKVNVIRNSSVGRLFDAVAAILGLGTENSHQAQCAQAVEALATEALKEHIEPLPLHLSCLNVGQEGIVWDPQELWHSLWSCALEAERASTPAEARRKLAAGALGFHLAVVEMIIATVKKISAQHAVQDIALCGGCFANRILLEQSLAQLTEMGFKVHFNQQAPPGDGGIALGQAYYGLLQNKS